MVAQITNNVSAMFDELLEMKDAGLVAATAAAQVDSVNKILDLGEAGITKATVIVDVTAIEIASNDELYKICVQLSSSSSFASGIVTPAKLELGANEVLLGDADSVVGRYEIPFSNRFAGTVYRYARIYTVVSGTIAGGGGINFAAFAAINQ